MNERPTFKSLGKQTAHVYSGADATLLERAPNPMRAAQEQGCTTRVVIAGDEFTSQCPATGGPDFGTITVEYEPREWIVESKSFKLYTGSFRAEPIFHEAVVTKICLDLRELLNPKWIEVRGDFKARGGWAICPRAMWSDRDA